MAVDPGGFDATAAAAVNRIIERRTAAANGSLAARPDLCEPTISQRLQRKYGLGDQPKKRQALYKQLELLHERFPEEVLRIISEAVVSAAGARHPDRYFCRAVKAKIHAEGLTIHKNEEVKW